MQATNVRTWTAFKQPAQNLSILDELSGQRMIPPVPLSVAMTVPHGISSLAMAQRPVSSEKTILTVLDMFCSSFQGSWTTGALVLLMTCFEMKDVFLVFALLFNFFSVSVKTVLAFFFTSSSISAPANRFAELLRHSIAAEISFNLE